MWMVYKKVHILRVLKWKNGILWFPNNIYDSVVCCFSPFRKLKIVEKKKIGTVAYHSELKHRKVVLKKIFLKSFAFWSILIVLIEYGFCIFVDECLCLSILTIPQWNSITYCFVGFWLLLLLSPSPKREIVKSHNTFVFCFDAGRLLSH